MKILIVTVCRNEARMMPWFLRHYSFADEIHIWHNDCTSNCTSHDVEYESDDPKCPPTVRNYHYNTGGVLRDDIHSFLKCTHHKLQHGFDWCIAVDMDEFIYHPTGVRAYLERCDEKGLLIPKTIGINMVGDGFIECPNGIIATIDGDNEASEALTEVLGVVGLTDIVQNGVPDDNYSKYAVFSTKADIQYGAGCHPHDTKTYTPTGWRPVWDVVFPADPELKLLHYRFWSEEDSAKKAESIVLSEYNLANNLGTHGQTSPEHEKQAYRDMKSKRERVL